jgi:hypothetical protein
MNGKKIHLGKSPVIKIQAGGSLVIRGWAEDTAMFSGDEFQVDEQEGNWSIIANGDLHLMVPIKATITVNEANGDVAIKNIENSVRLGQIKGDVVLQNLLSAETTRVFGDLSIRNLSDSCVVGEALGDVSFREVGDLSVRSIYGDCAVSFVNGSVEILQVMGDIVLRTINGDVTISEGRRDVNIRNIGGTCHVNSVHGDVRMRGGLSSGKHRLTADGDIVIRWPGDAPLVVEARAADIKNRLDLVDVIEENDMLGGSLGEGQTFLFLNSKGRIILNRAEAMKDENSQFNEKEFSFNFDLGQLGEYVTSEIDNHMANFSARMQTEFGPEFAARLEQTAQEAATKAEKATEKAIKQAEKAATRLRWQAGGDSWNSAYTGDQDQSSQKQKTSSKEQLQILHMVEKGIISPEEAATLLDALNN